MLKMLLGCHCNLFKGQLQQNLIWAKFGVSELQKQFTTAMVKGWIV